MRLRPALLLVLLAAAAGLFFSAWSTSDFAAHLDREVHGIHCSFVPGLEQADVSGSSGCHVTLMSPYSSVFRTALWGGLPISLPAMGVFAFLLYRALDLLLNRREDDREATGFLALATLLPVVASVGMGWLSLVELGATCKLCVGIYTSSGLACLGAVIAWRQAVAQSRMELGELDEAAANPWPGRIGAFVTGVAFVAVPSAVYAAMAPDHGSYLGTCGELTRPDDPHGVFIDLGGSGASAIEVLDPLCPSCKGFEDRLEVSGIPLHRQVVLFPLDGTCNWMVDGALHPGACSVSEAVLCAGAAAPLVLAWAFDNQEAIRVASETDPAAASRMVTVAFPDLASCVGSDKARARLNRSLRWVVANRLPVLTPQLFVEGRKLCDADTDLGMDYMLSRLVEAP